MRPAREPVLWASRPQPAPATWRLLAQERPSLVTLDVALHGPGGPDDEGLTLLDEIVDLYPLAKVVMVTGNADPLVHPERLGKLAVFEGVRNYPVRVKCASLAWHTLRSAVDAKDEVVSTEAE